jgi:hypothetical protein
MGNRLTNIENKIIEMQQLEHTKNNAIPMVALKISGKGHGYFYDEIHQTKIC